MLIAVSTIKDIKPNIEFFLDENRKSGVDHFFIFFEGELPLDPKDYPFATFVSSYELNPNMNNLNTRQEDNLNRTLQYLLSKNIDGWVACIDGDEIINFDKKILDELPHDIKSFKLHPIEPIKSDINERSQHKLFKKCLNKEEHSIARALNFVRDADWAGNILSNRGWLSGHMIGKSITKIQPGCKLSFHFPHGVACNDTIDADVVHYESVNFEEFVRKYSNNSLNPLSYGSHQKIFYDFFKKHKNDIDFLEKARELWKENISEKDIGKKKELGFVFELKRKFNQAETINVFSEDELKELSYFFLHHKYASILKDYAIEFHQNQLHVLSSFFISFAYTSKPWDTEIIELKDKLCITTLNTSDFSTEIKEAKQRNIFNLKDIEIFLELQRNFQYYRQAEMLDIFNHILGNKEDIFEVVSQGDTPQRTLIYFDRMDSHLLSSLSAFDYFTQLFNEQDEDIKIQNYTSMLIHQGVNFVKRHNLSEIADFISTHPLPPQNHSLYAQIYYAYLMHRNHSDADKVYQEGKLYHNMNDQMLAHLGPFLREYTEEINDDKNGRIHLLQAKLADRNKRMDNMRTRIAHKDNRLNILRTQVVNKDKRISDLQSQVANKDKSISDLQKQAAHKSKRIKRQNRNLNITKNELLSYKSLFEGRTGKFLKAMAFISPKSRRLLREIERKNK